MRRISGLVRPQLAGVAESADPFFADQVQASAPVGDAGAQLGHIAAPILGVGERGGSEPLGVGEGGPDRLPEQGFEPVGPMPLRPGGATAAGDRRVDAAVAHVVANPPVPAEGSDQAAAAFAGHPARKRVAMPFLRGGPDVLAEGGL